MSYSMIGGIAGAAGSIGSSAIGASAAGGAARKTPPRQVALQNYGSSKSNNALQQYVARLLMANVNTRPPSFDEWAASGGRAQYQTLDPGLTVDEAQKMGFVGNRGTVPPKFDVTNPQDLTEEQMVFMGREQAQSRKQKGQQAEGWPESPEMRLARLVNQRDTLEQSLSTGTLSDKKRLKQTIKLNRTKRKIDRATRD